MHWKARADGDSPDYIEALEAEVKVSEDRIAERGREYARRARRVTQAKANGASPVVVEALEAEMYEVKLTHTH